ncbi:TPA: DUF550 domain-containing protein [Salmonella enterica]|uniref:DUF550 domain-containing protein n=3 Tax=Salmonella enterica TaxID=28901 RepID=A0A747J7A4_SALER|nr:DUF550 domain-containing protein [Salmonella enterica]HAF2690398.1 DUF550 domain-containing protein [Salmonella enterica]HAF2737406.1 DUF550 domain-containing protein [Salmonella enterica]HAF3248020.1 DUF550 domain-containing protein [Salmonella enterica]HAF3485583.1 DUF550 domain-containing protein [Salmonella enterica]
MTTITKEWLQQTIAEFENTRDDIPFGLSDDDAKILIVLKRALASLEREQVRHEHAEWSDATFGNVGPVGPLKHLSKEALEAAADPSDPLEWADMQFLLWDAQRRMGLSDEFITRAMIEKLEINKSRQWPEPKDGEPRLHIKEHPAPVVPEEITSASAPEIFEIAAEAERLGLRGSYASYAVGWNACRAAMLQGVEPVSNHDELALYYLQGKKDGLEWAAQLAEANHPYTGDWLYDDPLDLAKAIRKGPDMPEFAGSSPVIPNGYNAALLKVNKNASTALPNNASLSTNSPVIPGGWISCSERMPEDEQEVIVHNKLGYRYVSYFDEHSGLFFDMRGGNQMNCIEHILVTHWMPLPAAPQQ